MKLAWTILATTISVLPVVLAQSGLRVDAHRDLIEDKPSRELAAKLVKEKYGGSGLGADAELYWINDGCEYTSSIYLTTQTNVYKYQTNGKPSKTKGTYVDGYLYEYFDCDSDGYSYLQSGIHAWQGNGEDAFDLEVAKQLDVASFLYSGEAEMILERWNLICPENVTYCYYDYGERTYFEAVPVTVDVDWTATGTLSTYSESNTYKGDNYIFRSQTKGKRRPASFTMSWLLNGDEVIPSSGPSETYGSITQVTSRSMDRY